MSRKNDLLQEQLILQPGLGQWMDELPQLSHAEGPGSGKGFVPPLTRSLLLTLLNRVLDQHARLSSVSFPVWRNMGNPGLRFLNLGEKGSPPRITAFKLIPRRVNRSHHVTYVLSLLPHSNMTRKRPYRPAILLRKC
jgi:hypothetical protein